MWKEFKEFAIKGNVVDLSIGIVVGGAFGKIVTSFVNDIITPLMSPLMGRVPIANLFLSMDGKFYKTAADAKTAGTAAITYGNFISTVIDFLIVSFSIFLVIKQINRFKRKTPPPEPNTKTCPFCITKISKEAVRCPHCTSHLENSTDKPQEAHS